MKDILNILETPYFDLGLIILIMIVIILYIANIVKLGKIRRNYISFMNKIGNGDNIQESLEKYVKQVQTVEAENKKLKQDYKQLEDVVNGCIQKVGLIRYSAFKDTGSDLSFTLALLNNENTGVVLNGIYSRDMSNIYSKPVEKGISTYTLSEEEKQAIEKAMKA